MNKLEKYLLAGALFGITIGGIGIIKDSKALEGLGFGFGIVVGIDYINIRKKLYSERKYKSNHYSRDKS